MAQLASPGELRARMQPRASSYIESDLQQDGADFDVGLANNLVTTDSAVGVFSPSFIPDDSLTSAAYATYNFNISGYDRNPQVRYEWQSPPGPGHLWLGLSDWDTDSWEWFRPDPAAVLNLPGIEPFIRSDGELLVVVLVTGTQQDRLTSLRIGSLRPVIAWDVTNAGGFVPFTCSIDASASSDPDGTIAGYEWDLDGNGSYEVSGTDSTQEIEVSETGAFDVMLRVTDNDGVSAVRQVTVRGFSEWIHSWGGGQHDDIKDCAYDGGNNLYFVGYTTSFGGGFNDLLLLKYGLDGELKWAYTWGGIGSEIGWAAEVDNEGNLVVLLTSSGMLALAKFSPDGECLWANRYSYAAYTSEVRDLSVTGTEIYACGYSHDPGMPGTNYGVLARINGEGELQWMAHASGTIFNALQWHTSFLGDPRIHVTGSFGGSVLHLQANTDGELVSAGKWGGASTSEQGYDISVSGYGLATSVWISGFEYLSGESKSNLLLVERTYTGTPVCRVWDGGANDYNATIMYSGSDFYLGGNSTSFSPEEDSVLLGFNDSLVLEHSSRLWNGGGKVFINRHNLYAGVAVVGGGVCVAADGSTWSACSGSTLTRSYQWSEAAITMTPVTPAVFELTGSLGTPSSAAVDTGGGDVDAMAMVREAP